MGPVSPERSISCEAMAHVPQESSRGHFFTVPTLTFGILYCFFGLLYWVAKIWCSGRADSQVPRSRSAMASPL
jgi:hypothetical protein